MPAAANPDIAWKQINRRDICYRAIALAEFVMALDDAADSQAILSLALPDTVSARELADILNALAALYDNRLWVETTTEEPASPLVGYRKADALIVVFATIGTPNKIDLIGKAKQIAQVAVVLAELLGLPTATLETYKSFNDYKIVQIERENASLEIKINQLEVEKLNLEEATAKLEHDKKIDATLAAQRRNQDAEARTKLQRYKNDIKLKSVIEWQAPRKH
jgi:hypothetical protein